MPSLTSGSGSSFDRAALAAAMLEQGEALLERDALEIDQLLRAAESSIESKSPRSFHSAGMMKAANAHRE